MNFQEQIRRVLRGQQAPMSQRSGVRVLYRCPACGKPWHQNGPDDELQLSPERLHALAFELGADVSNLPPALCLLCAWRVNGEYTGDEYAPGAAYGVSWEGMEPAGAHLLFAGMSDDWIALLRIVPPRAHVVTDPRSWKEFLAWVALMSDPLSYRIKSADECAWLAEDNLPGHKAPGTEQWRWRGIDFSADCPPLGGPSLFSVSMAVPPHEQLRVPLLLELTRGVAAFMHGGSVAGEELV